MKLYSEQELRILIENKAIRLVGEELILDNEYITTNKFVQSMKQIVHSNKGTENKIESLQCEDLREYRKQTQKSKNKRRKSK